jgi:hypothetical protein
MHPTTLLFLADHKMAEYRREADDHRLASQARRRPATRPTVGAGVVAGHARGGPMTASQTEC